MSRLQLRGVIPPVVTPLLPDGTVDEESLGRHVEYLIGKGVHGIFALGSAGEGPLLRQSDRRRVVAAAIAAIDGRVPLIVGVSDTSVERVREQMVELTVPGVDAFVATPPFYGSFDEADVQRRFFESLADASRRPLILYNIPQAVHSRIEPQTAIALAAHPKIIALKDSSGDLARFQRVIARRPDPNFGVFQGAEILASASLFVGATGFVAGLANVVPGWLVEMYDAGGRGDWKKVHAIQARFADVQRLYSHGYWLGCLKTAVNLLGFGGPTVIGPNLPTDAAGATRIRKILRQHDLIE